MFKTGKYSQEGKELIKGMRELRRTGEALLAVSLDARGMSHRLPAMYRRRKHVKRALAAAAAAKKAREEQK